MILRGEHTIERGTRYLEEYTILRGEYDIERGMRY
jgi:hypothetical protein